MVYVKSSSSFHLQSVALFLAIICISFFTHCNGDITSQVQEWGNKYKKLIQEMKQEYQESKLGITNVTLAEERTRRRDPLDGFHYYTGGWNYKNKHYWASVVFAALPLLIIALVWFLSLGVFLCCAFLRCCCTLCSPRKKRRSNSKLAYNVSLALLLLASAAAISGSVIIYVYQHKFYDSVFDAMEYIMNIGLGVFDRLKVVVNAFATAAALASNQLSLPGDMQSSINAVNTMVTAMASIPQLQSSAMTNAIHQVLFPARLALNIIVGIVLAFILLGLVFSLLGLRRLVYLFAILSWMIVVLLFVLSAIFLVFRIAVADACVAMEEWLRNPTTNSTMNQVLPCLSSDVADQTLSVSKATVYFMVNSTNQFDMGIANGAPIGLNLSFSYNQSGPLLPPLCNPINPDMTYRACQHGEVNIANVSQEFDKYKCEASGQGTCMSPGRLTPYMYDQLVAVVNVSYCLYSAGPFLVEVGQCSFVLKTLTEITESYCPDLRKYSYRTFVGLTVISSSSLVCLICWICHVTAKHELWEAKRYKSLSNGPSKPW